LIFIETNPYLLDPEKFGKALITNVSSSTAVETGASVESIARTLVEGNQAPHVQEAARHRSIISA